MMLIDADRLINDIQNKWKEDDFIPVDRFIDIVKYQPTAYDLEKIVEQIKKATDEHGLVDYINKKQVISKEQAIEIVKAGGVNETD